MRYSERLPSLKLRISCFGLRKMQLRSLSPDYSKWFSFRLQLSFWRRKERYRQFEHQEMRIRINVQIILNLTLRPCLPQYINRCCRQTLLSLRCPFDQSEFGSAWAVVKCKLLITKEDLQFWLFFIVYFVYCTIWVWFDFFFQAICFWFDLRRRNLSKKETNNLGFAYERIFQLKIITVAFQLYRSW